jgi:hypothetical protein
LNEAAELKWPECQDDLDIGNYTFVSFTVFNIPIAILEK